MTYREAQQMLATARNRADGKPLGNNTRLKKSGHNFVIVLHSTAVVTICPNGTYVLHTGGWRTMTTKDRINCYSPARVFQHRREWFIGDEPFYDGIRVRADGTVVQPRKVAA